MRIAQISPLYESVPPRLYGGTERVVSYLTEELVRMGHEVTLFASGDSKTEARLIAPCKQALRLDPDCADTLAPHFIMMQDVITHHREFDVLHFHIDYLHFPVSQFLNYTHLTTLHGRLDIPFLYPLHKRYSDIPLVSISDYQRKPLPFVNWIGTVYHGLPINHLKEGSGKGDYLAFLGRISPEKGLEKAIDIARRTGIKLLVAAKIDRADQQYFENYIRHLFDDPLVEYIGEINEDEKQEFLGNALALLFPIQWVEPFGLVMIEAMATGTPVIAFRNGSVPEVVDDGITGAIVSSEEEAARAIQDIHRFNRRVIRRIFEARFTSQIMARNYLHLYDFLSASKGLKRRETFVATN